MLQHLPGASAAKLADSDSSDTASQTSSGNDMKGVARGIGGGCPLGLDALRFPWASPLGFSLARCGRLAASFLGRHLVSAAVCCLQHLCYLASPRLVSSLPLRSIASSAL